MRCALLMLLASCGPSPCDDYETAYCSLASTCGYCLALPPGSGVSQTPARPALDTCIADARASITAHHVTDYQCSVAHDEIAGMNCPSFRAFVAGATGDPCSSQR